MVLLAAWMMAFSLILPETAAASALRALSLCAESVIPSLAVFVIGAKILIKTGFCEMLAGTPIRHLCPHLGLSCAGLTAFLIGLVSGFPMGAVALSELVRHGAMTKEEAQCLMPYCNNAGPAFVIGTVGGAFLGSAGVGVLLFASQTAASVTALLLTAGERKKYAGLTGPAASVGARRPKNSAARIVSSSVAEGASALLCICGFVVFFSVLSDSVLALFSALNWTPVTLFAVFLRGFLEISGGMAAVGAADGIPLPVMYALSGAMLGFGGLSVWMQAADRAGAADIPVKGYLTGKLLCALLCAFFAVLLGAPPWDFPEGLAVVLPLFAGCLFVFAVRRIKNQGFFKKRVEK